MLDDMIFGVATSAYQIEGAWNQDGKVPSIWDEISHGKKAWKVQNGHTGDIACNHYNEWKNDIDIMKHLGIQAYRFSISWSRICTQDCVCSNLKGIEFYRKLVKGLKEAGIEPFVTLYHWDIPKWLDDIGGWSNPRSVDYFKCYAETMFEALPDVKHWITFNEPAVFVNNFWGLKEKSKAIKNVLLAHGKTVQLFRKKVYANPTTHKNPNGKIGISLNLMPFYPYRPDNEQDKQMVDKVNKRHNGIWLDPILKGKFPEGISEAYGWEKGTLKLSKKEKEIISTPIDFLGVNYYSGATIKYNEDIADGVEQVSDKHRKRDEMGVGIRPEGLYDLLLTLKEEYNNPEIYITENGCALPDVLGHDNKIHDTDRIKYIKDHLESCVFAVEDDVNLKGYFYWSFMDNFEWLYGYNKRFGLLYMFWPTQSRVCKDSYHWYRQVITDKDFRDKVLGG